MSARLVQDVSKISKENVTNVADWIKKAEVKDVSLVLIRGNWENVVPRRGLWEVGRGYHNFGFDFTEFEVFGRRLKTGLMSGGKTVLRIQW